MTSGEAAEAALVALLDRLNAIARAPAPIPIIKPPDFDLLLDDKVRTGREIIMAVEHVCGVRHLDFISHRRWKSYGEARQIAYWFMRHFTTLSTPHIGHLVGGRDHSTVMYGIKRVNENPELFGPRLEAVAKMLKLEWARELKFQ